MKYKAASCWMAYEVLQNIDTDLDSGIKSLKGKKFRIFLIAVIEIIFSARNRSGGNQGLISSLINIIFAFLEEVWDLVKNFSLPAIIIDDIQIKKLPERLSSLKQNIPAALVGVLGFDLIGGMLGLLIGSLFSFGFIFGGGVGYYFPNLFPESWMFQYGGFVINSLPVFFCIFISSIVISFINNAVVIIKSIYFTTFYTALHNPDIIHGDVRSEVTNYLNFNDRLEGYDFFAESKS